MCKIFAMTDASHVQITPRLIRSVRDAVCAGSDRDGFGYSVLSKDGKLGGERSIEPMTFNPGNTPSKDSVTDKLPIVRSTRNHFGSVTPGGNRSFMAHARLSTNSVSLENTHPFYNGKVSMIHNGVVNDATGGVKDKLTTDCDSEILLRYWEKGGMEAIEENVSGYYGIVIQDYRGTMHVIRDSRARLYIAWCRSIKSFLIATTEDILKSVAKSMKWKIEQPELITEDIHAVFQGNDIVMQRDIQPCAIPAASGLSALASRAFGASVVDDYDSMSYSSLSDSDMGASDYEMMQYGKYFKK
jgi:predicted glutamine amidotransferase